MKNIGFFVILIPAILAMYQISLKLIFDIPNFINGENSELILYDSLGSQLYSNAQATMHLAFGYSHQFGKRISVRSQTLADCLGTDRLHAEAIIASKGVKWRTYFARNGSHILFLNDSEAEIKRAMYNSCILYLLGFLPIIAILVFFFIKRKFIGNRTKI